jgi:8-oxo-dGTP diphosphatase
VGFTVLRDRLLAEVAAIRPGDAAEAADRQVVLDWINSGADLYRRVKPDQPPMHLVSYFALVDPKAGSLLLVDHINAGLWLPTGGHVEPDEDPADTVRREVGEELGIAAAFWAKAPVMVTVTTTVGRTAGHVDVSLWYVLTGAVGQALTFDRSEFTDLRWFGFDDLPMQRTIPDVPRFVRKLRGLLG